MSDQHWGAHAEDSPAFIMSETDVYATIEALRIENEKLKAEIAELHAQIERRGSIFAQTYMNFDAIEPKP